MSNVPNVSIARRRPGRILAASLAAGVLLGGALPMVSSDLPSAWGATQLVKNGTFYSGVSGWKTNGADELLRHTSNGRNGGAAELRFASGTGNVALNDAKATVTNAVAGAKYTMTAWVKAKNPGIGGHLRVRAVSGTTETHRQYFKLDNTEWTKVSFTFANKNAGAKFDLNVIGYALNSSNALYVDDVSLMAADPTTAHTPPKTSTNPNPDATPTPDVNQAEPSEIGGYLTNNGTYSKIGIPSKDAYFGAAVGSNTDPSSFEEEVGGKLGIRRTFYQANQVDNAVRNATTDLKNDRLPWISFKLPYTWKEMTAGKGDAWAKDLTAKLDALNGPVWIAFHHEPETEQNIADWTAMQKRLSPIVKQNSDNIAFTTILMGYHQLYGENQYSLENTWPGDGLVDIVAFDVYNYQDTVKKGKVQKASSMDAYFEHLAAFAEKHNVHWGVAETGLNDTAAKNSPEWMEETYQQIVNRGGVAMSYFNTHLNSSTSWAISDSLKTKQFADVLESSAKMK
ncbi:MAG TPA: carbohydrate-binding protein CenC [Glutamicibacter sp.]|nr:carbohydrate-binding protein CenC [Glutamicibacter sp.]